MKRIFCRGTLRDEMIVTGADARHIIYSLRSRKGDSVVVVDEEQNVARMEMIAFSADTVTLKIAERLTDKAESPLKITLAPSLLKADKTEFVVQKAAELGANEIVPLITQNTVVRHDEKKAAAKHARLVRIAEEAAKQCGRGVIPDVSAAKSLDEFLAAAKSSGAAVLFFYENAASVPLRERLQKINAAHVAVVVGPEGGFTKDEAERAKRAGCVVTSLGPRILRAETAALAALSIVQYEKGDL